MSSSSGITGMNSYRSTMVALIAKVRLLINDPAGASQQFTDNAIQDALDDWRRDVRYEQLTPAPTLYNVGGVANDPAQSGIADYNWTDYYSAYQWWEGGTAETLSDGHFITLTPAFSDDLVGHWVFNLPTPGQYPPVFMTGRVYDIYAAAADLLDMWSAALITFVDFTADGRSFRLSQLSAGKQRLADIYRRRALPMTAKAVRRDLNSPDSSTEVTLLGVNDDIITR